MKLFKTTLIATALVAAGFVGNAAAAGSSKDQTFTVNIAINGSCKFISADNITFDATEAAAKTVDATGNIKVQCTKNLPFTLDLNAGANGGGDVNARKMKRGTNNDTISYQLFTSNDAVWGNSQAVPGTGAGIGGDSLNRTFQVKAKATLTGEEPAGSYTDTVTATINY